MRVTTSTTRRAVAALVEGAERGSPRTRSTAWSIGVNAMVSSPIVVTMPTASTLTFQLKLQKVELENDRSSCVLVPFEGAGPAAQSSGTDAKDEKILGVLEKEFGADGGTATEWQRACTEKIGVPHNTSGQNE